jgi:hypothetical protein
MTESQPVLSEITSVLARTPKALAGLLEGLPDAWLDTREKEGTFSPRDVVGHLIHAERADWVPRVQIILESGESRPFVPFDRYGYKDGVREISALLDQFAKLRAENLATLEGYRLDDAALAKTGTHPELGRVTLGQLLATWATHDLNHVDQVTRVMSRRYDRAVGPWKVYLGILNR